MPQRRQPITHAEVEAVRRTGQLPLMTDPVKPGRAPHCHNCCHWEKTKARQGLCHHRPAKEKQHMGPLEMVYSVQFTGAQYTCPAHQGYEVITETKTTTP